MLYDWTFCARIQAACGPCGTWRRHASETAVVQEPCNRGVRICLPWTNNRKHRASTIAASVMSQIAEYHDATCSYTRLLSLHAISRSLTAVLVRRSTFVCSGHFGTVNPPRPLSSTGTPGRESPPGPASSTIPVGRAVSDPQHGQISSRGAVGPWMLPNPDVRLCKALRGRRARHRSRTYEPYDSQVRTRPSLALTGPNLLSGVDRTP